MPWEEKKIKKSENLFPLNSETNWQIFQFPFSCPRYHLVKAAFVFFAMKRITMKRISDERKRVSQTWAYRLVVLLNSQNWH